MTDPKNKNRNDKKRLPLKEQLEKNRAEKKEKAKERSQPVKPPPVEKKSLREQFDEAVKNNDPAQLKVLEHQGFNTYSACSDLLKEYHKLKYDEKQQVKVFEFLFDGCDYPATTPLAIDTFMKLIWANRFKAAQIFIDHGLDIHTAKMSGFGTVFEIFEKKLQSSNASSNRFIKFMIEQGANIHADNQALLKRMITAQHVTQASVILNNGGQINAQNGDFAIDCLNNIFDQFAQSKIENSKVLMMLQYMSFQGLNLAAHDFKVLDFIQNHPASEKIDGLHGKLSLIIRDTLRVRPDVKTDPARRAITLAQNGEFLNTLNAELSDTGKTTLLSYTALLQKDGKGYRVIDYLAAQGDLKDIFSPALWRAREGDALRLAEKTLPYFKDQIPLNDLKMNKRIQSAKKHTKPLKRRK